MSREGTFLKNIVFFLNESPLSPSQNIGKQKHPSHFFARLFFWFVVQVAIKENGKHFGSSPCWLVFQLEPDFLRDFNLRNAFKSPPLLLLSNLPARCQFLQLVQTKHSHRFCSFSHKVEFMREYVILRIYLDNVQWTSNHLQLLNLKANLFFDMAKWKI